MARKVTMPLTEDLAQPITLAIVDTGKVVSATVHHLSILPNCKFDVCIDNAEHDEISEAIRTGSFAGPWAYHLFASLYPFGQQILDLGGHIGTFAFLAASLGHKVTVVEASPRNATLLQEGARLNGFDTVNVVSTAISNQVGTIDFIEAGPYGVVANTTIEGPRTTVPATTVDELLTRVGWETVDAIKMDIEGSEIAALEGMTDHLSRQEAPTFFFEINGFTLHLFDNTPQDLLALFERYGYTCYKIARYTLIPLPSDRIVPELCIDCLAVKGTLPRLPKWTVLPAFSKSQIIARLLRSATDANPKSRTYTARSLQTADADLLDDIRIITILYGLQADPVEEVREAAAWWQSPLPSEVLPRLSRMLADQEREVEHLQSLVRGYETGKVMRAMAFAQGIPARVKAAFTPGKTS